MIASAGRSWLRALADARSIGAFSFGVVSFGALTLAFALMQIGFSSFGPRMIGDSGQVRVAITHIACFAYLMGAFVHAARSYEESIRRIAPMLDSGPELERALDTSHERTALLIAGFAGVGIWLLATVVSPGSDWFDPREWNVPIVWHRVMGLGLGVLGTRLGVLLVLQSSRLSQLAKHIHELDLLDLSGLQAFTRQGLTNALLIPGFAAAFSLFLLTPGYLGLAGGAWLLASLVAGTGLLLPLLGVRRRIREAKQAELGWCRARLREARRTLAEGQAGARIDELLAWEARVESIREWPLDTTALSRFGLYLLIPLGSWSAAALVERFIDRALG